MRSHTNHWRCATLKPAKISLSLFGPILWLVFQSFVRTFFYEMKSARTAPHPSNGKMRHVALNVSRNLVVVILKEGLVGRDSANTSYGMTQTLQQ